MNLARRWGTIRPEDCITISGGIGDALDEDAYRLVVKEDQTLQFILNHSPEADIDLRFLGVSTGHVVGVCVDIVMPEIRTFRSD